MRFNGGIGYEIDQLKDLGVPELMRKQSIDPQLKYALALQEATKLVEAAARERDMAQQMPVPADVIGQMETSLAQKLTPGVQQMGQRSMQGAPPQMAPPQMDQGISGMPAPNMGAIGSAQGGIIGYQQGGPIAPSVLAETTAYMKAKAVLADPQATPQAKAFARDTLDTLRPINAGGSVDLQTYAQMLQQVDSLTAFSTQPQQNIGMKKGGSLDKILDSLKMAESSGNPLARGEAGELGAYQIMPSTAADPGFGVAPFTGDLFDPVASRKFAQEYLQAMLDRYNGDMEAALVAYNAGAGNADKFVAAGNDYTALPRPEQTKTYVQRVMDTLPGGRISPRMQRALEASRRRETGETETKEDFINALAPLPAEGDLDPMAQRARAAHDRLKRGSGLALTNIMGPVSPYTSEEKAAGGLGYLQYLARRQQEQQSNNADKMRTAFPDLEENIAETNRSRAYTPEETTAGGLGYLQYLARKKREQQKQQSNIAGYLAQSQRAANTIAENDPSANHGVDIKLPSEGSETYGRGILDALEGGVKPGSSYGETDDYRIKDDPNYLQFYIDKQREQARLDRIAERIARRAYTTGFQKEDAMASGGIVGYAGLEGSTVEAEPATADEDTSDIEEDGMFASVINLIKENPVEAVSIALLLAPALVASTPTAVVASGIGAVGRAALPVIAKYGPRAFSAIRNVINKTYTKSIKSGYGSTVRNEARFRGTAAEIPASPLQRAGSMMSAANARRAGFPLNRSVSPGRMLQTGAGITGLISWLTGDGEEEAPKELSNADKMRAAFPGLEEHLANLKNQKASGISSVKPQQSNLFRALDVLSRGGGASKGYEFATINEETRRIKEAEQARQDNLYALSQRNEIAREQLGVARAGQSVDIQRAIMQALEEYESSPAYTRELAARLEAGETEEVARTFLLERKAKELAAMGNSGGNNSGLEGTPGLEQDVLAAAEYLRLNP